MSHPPAGWYPQPDGSQRYWDGTRWTNHSAPGATQPPAQSPYAGIDPYMGTTDPYLSTTGPASTPLAMVPSSGEHVRAWYQKKRFLLPGIALIGIALIGAFGQGSARLAPDISPAPVATEVAKPDPPPAEEA